MFEVERKFLYEEEKVALLIKDAEFLFETQLTDIYYDDEDHSLWLSDIFLRERNGKLELKVGAQDNSGETKIYKEYEGEEIANVLSQPLSAYAPRITIHKHRRSYTLSNARIDLDNSIINNKTYRIGEIECVSEHKETDAHAQLDALFSTYDLKPVIHGPVFLYIKETNPELFEKLTQKKRIRE